MSSLKIPIVLGVAMLAVLALLWTGISRNDIYMSPLETMDRDRATREPVRVVGWVAEGSVESADTELITTFTLRDEKGSLELPVVHAGVLPDLFREGVNVVVAGQFDADGVFVATELMTKCPSKYEGAEDLPGVPPAKTVAASPSPMGGTASVK